MDGYYDVKDGNLVWKFHEDSQPDILPEQIPTDVGVLPVVQNDRQGDTIGVCLPDLGRSTSARGCRG